MFASAFAVLKTIGLRRGARAPEIDTRIERAPGAGTVPPQPFACYVCDSPMALVEDDAMPEAGVADLRRHAMRCTTCGMMADRIYHQAFGYDRGLVL